jgi:hypothetical protein
MRSTRKRLPSRSKVLAKRRGSGSHPRLRPVVGLLTLTFILCGLMSGSAGAVNVFTLDTNPDSFAGQAVDAAGTGYFAWERKVPGSSDTTEFCRVPRGGTCPNPIVLPTPPLNPPPYDSTQVTAAFPVLGAGSTIYVVGPRFVAADVVVWKSTDGGATWGPAVQVTQSGAYRGSNPTDVLDASTGFYLSSDNPGLYFTSLQPGPPTTAGADLTPPGGLTNISGSTLGLSTGNPVEAFSMLNGGQPQTINFRSYSGSGDPNDAANWSGSSQVTQGILPSLAGGPGGLFLASEDYKGGSYSQVSVRKYMAGSGFGPPTTLQTDTSYDSAGRIYQTPTSGILLVAWPGHQLPDGGRGIRLFVSNNGGAAFTNVGDVAEGTPFYAIGSDSIRVAAANDGQGFVSFLDSGSGNQLLRVADLTPIPELTSGKASVSGFTITDNVTVSPGGTLILTSLITNPTVLASTAAGKRCKKGSVLVRKNGKKRCVSSSFGSRTLTLPKAGTYKVQLSPNAAAKKALNHGTTLHVKETLTFSPVGGGNSVAKTFSVTVHGKKHGH